MTQLLSSVTHHESAPPSTLEDVSPVSADVAALLLRCSELSEEIARMRTLVEQLAQNADPHHPGRRSHWEHRPTETSSFRDRRRRPAARSILRRSPTNGRSRGPVRSELARACRIALMETSEPVSVEAIYDRVQRRGSFTFAGYKHPFRAIVLAMGAMVRRGEVNLLNDAGRRRWRWLTERAPFEKPTPFTVA